MWKPPGDKLWSILLMVLAGRDRPSPPISLAVYLTSFGECFVSKIKQGNNNTWLSTYGEVMKERGMEWGKKSEGNEHRSKELQPTTGGFAAVPPILEVTEVKSKASILFQQWQQGLDAGKFHYLYAFSQARSRVICPPGFTCGAVEHFFLWMNLKLLWHCFFHHQEIW